MTEETLKYMEVQPVAVVLSLRNCLWNELKFGKLYKIKNIKVQHLLTHSLLITLQKRCVGFAMHFSLIYITYCPSSAILLTPLIVNCRLDVALRLTSWCGLLLSWRIWDSFGNSTCWWWLWFSTAASQKTLWKLYFVWQFMWTKHVQ